MAASVMRLASNDLARISAAHAAAFGSGLISLGKTMMRGDKLILRIASVLHASLIPLG